MSAVCGIFNLDGAPVDPEVLCRMAEASAYRGPDGTRYWLDGPVGLAHLALNSTPESLRETQPLVADGGDLVLVGDARVDNRPELISDLRDFLREKDPTDADLVLATYRKWGVDCAARILGDFAFVVWDRRERRLMCVRDPVGLRQLFYCRSDRTALVATTLASIKEASGHPLELNKLLIADFLCERFDRWQTESVWQGVYRLRSGHWLDLADIGSSPRRFWVFGSGPEQSFRRDEDYVERLKELLFEAVRCRLRSASPVGITVSGGLDSSTIACIAHNLSSRTDGGITPGQVCLYNWSFQRYVRADERTFVSSVVRACPGFDVSYVDGDAKWGLQEMAGFDGLPIDEPEIDALRSMSSAMYALAGKHGGRVMLLGEGGDQLFSNAAYFQPEFMLDLGPLRAAREWPHFWNRCGRSIIATVSKRLAIDGLRRFAPDEARQWRRRRTLARSAPPWLMSNWARHLAMSADIAPQSAEQSKRPYTTRRILNRVGSGWYMAVYSTMASIAAAAGMEVRLPYGDRRLIEFMLELPPRLHFRRGRSREIMRRATVGLLPEEVRARRSKADFGEAVDYGLRQREVPRVLALLDDVEEHLSDFLDMQLLRQWWAGYHQGLGKATHINLRPLLMAAWLRQNHSSISGSGTAT